MSPCQFGVGHRLTVHQSYTCDLTSFFTSDHRLSSLYASRYAPVCWVNVDSYSLYPTCSAANREVGGGDNRGSLPRAPSVRGAPNSAELFQISHHSHPSLASLRGSFCRIVVFKSACFFASHFRWPRTHFRACKISKFPGGMPPDAPHTIYSMGPTFYICPGPPQPSQRPCQRSLHTALENHTRCCSWVYCIRRVTVVFLI